MLQTYTNLQQQLIEWADRYEITDFIETDPIRFPHRFMHKQDIEISALLSSYLAFGKREIIIRKVEELHQILGASPHTYILEGKFTEFPRTTTKFYRFISYSDMNDLLSTLRSYYLHFKDLEVALQNENTSDPIEALQNIFGHIRHFPASGTNSGCKRISMFLRWMCRTRSPVDIGIWESWGMEELLIPLDTHVHQMSLQLGITTRKIADMRTALEIRDFFKKIFPSDPSRGDFALFGYAMDNPNYRKERKNST